MMYLGILIILTACGLPFGALYLAGDVSMSVEDFANWVLAAKYLLAIGTLLTLLGATFDEMSRPESPKKSS